MILGSMTMYRLLFNNTNIITRFQLLLKETKLYTVEGVCDHIVTEGSHRTCCAGNHHCPLGYPFGFQLFEMHCLLGPN